VENFILTQDNADSLWKLMASLYPIHRTLVNRGFQKSMEIIGREIPLRITKVPSGTKVWDWVVPDAWEVKEAYIEDMRGNRLVDFHKNNLHLAAYSVAFRGKVTRDELMKHLIWSDALPDAIPYAYEYYTHNWKFSIAKMDLSRLKDPEYTVVIDVDKKPGEMWLGDCLLPGETKQEIVLSTYLCHPSLANDSLSGVVCGVEIFKALSQIRQRRFSYRLLIVPETVGCIAYLATHEDWIPKIEGGYVLTCCGDKGPVTYKKSYFASSLIDRAALHVLQKCRGDRSFRVQEFSPEGSDERQFNAPGVRVPFGSLMRTPYAEYAEYHTSKDDLSVVNPENLLDTVDVLLQILRVLDNNVTYKNKYRGEPFLSKHGLHIPFITTKDAGFLNQVIIQETDGRQDILSIADK